MDIHIPDNADKAVIDFSAIPYERTLEERALFPYSTLNFLTGGIVQGTITVLAADAGAGKTTMSSDIIDSILKDGDKLMCVYGEGTQKDTQIKMYRQMTPYRDNNFKYIPYFKNGKKTNVGSFFVDEDSEAKVKNKTHKNLFLYDIRYGMSIPKLLGYFEWARVKHGVKYFILDNLSQIDFETQQETKELKDGMELLRKYSIEKLVGFLVIAHYRKAQDVQRIRRDMTEIMGTSAVSQKSVTVINLMRMDYLDRTTTEFKKFARLMSANGYDINKKIISKSKKAIEKYEISAVAEVLKSRNNKIGFCCFGYSDTTQTYWEVEKTDKTTSDMARNDETQSVIHLDKIDDLTPLSGFDKNNPFENDGQLPF